MFILFIFLAIPASAQRIPCEGGQAGAYPCNNIDLLAHMSMSEVGGGPGIDANDIWGWVDPVTGTPYALLGRENGTAFVDLSDPEQPVYVGALPTHSSASLWRDIKVYADHAFIVSEASSHGMQVFDLTQLRSVTAPPVVFSETAHYAGIGNAHNIVINEDTGFAYIVGSRGSSNTCSGGLHMVNIQTPASPVFAGCFSSDGYTHDAQCVIYHGPDAAHQGKEVCFNANEDTVTIVDVSNKSNPVQLSRTGYPQSAYTHQGWLTEDHAYFVQDDELDEASFGGNTRTLIWDVTDLDDPILATVFNNPAISVIDHNQYIKGSYSYQSNYTAGLRILDMSDVLNPVEAAFFDTVPSSNSASFQGSWSNFPFFDNGIVIVSSIQEGLFVLEPQLDAPSLPDLSITLTPSNPPIVLPPEGGNVRFGLEVTNNTDLTQAFDVWLALNSTGVLVKLIGPVHATLDPGGIFTRNLRILIPAGSPAGLSTLEGLVGLYPSGELDSDAFTFVKESGTSSTVNASTTLLLSDSDTGARIQSHDKWSATTTTATEKDDLPYNFTLSQNYPNPFNPTTSIRYALTEPGAAHLAIYDALGKLVRTLVTGQQAPGTHTVEWDATDYTGHQVTSGFYVYRLVVNGQEQSRTMILLK